MPVPGIRPSSLPTFPIVHPQVVTEMHEAFLGSGVEHTRHGIAVLRCRHVEESLW
jgi:hypothetical protein